MKRHKGHTDQVIASFFNPGQYNKICEVFTMENNDLLNKRVYISIPEGKTTGVIKEVRKDGQVKIHLGQDTFIMCKLNSKQIQGIQIELGEFM